jgi:hypothetical protein
MAVAAFSPTEPGPPAVNVRLATSLPSYASPCGPRSRNCISGCRQQPSTEPGAELSLLRWKYFVQSEDDDELAVADVDVDAVKHLNRAKRLAHTSD